MSIWVDVATVSSGVNVVVLLALSAVWARNYLTFRSKHAVGLLVFGVFLLAENALAFYMYILDPTLSGWFSTDVPVIAWRLMMLLHVFETFGLVFLAWITFD
ncbi:MULTISPECIES: hypothetical protein [Haloferax]|uniref:Uncharacterized protein n=1 Tax=Haloferax gibbonsii TaxID=35746 RepID=A0A0K1ITZ0_HALGI|nr:MULTISPECIES: hypothetical protein [Haloferax]AKU08017.1 hypothetical protein ABY42_09790 [Haloferax gibbonsii]QOS12889.1 uncharacterized protein HfgLR_13805 [Haloferax gibbonsii]RDZ44995.1 hypothetical protein C5B87_12625 [Haloferax sp. Atlit-16N]RDZ48347.1 hypothetical protein C5B86_04690 [Haloferax sp. Atlit-19N]RDZ52836.1 hypothetical protein C5C07_13845 [Haloferax sp. Atlit-4N]